MNNPGRVMFFDEDFDQPAAPPAPAEPQIIEPVFSLADLDAARAQAAETSRTRALDEAAASAKAAAAEALRAIAASLVVAREDAAQIAEQSAEAVTRLLLDCFATAFPALSARHGPREAAAVLNCILPVLHHEPTIAVRVNPHEAANLGAEILALDPDLADRIRLVPTDAMAPGDVRVTWENGSAVRDAKAIWTQIEDVLAQAGLLSAKQTIREHALVD